MILLFSSSDFTSLSLNNTGPDPTTWEASRWVISTDPDFAPAHVILDTWLYGDYAGSPRTTADVLADEPSLVDLELDSVMIDVGVLTTVLYIRLYQRDNLGFISEPGELLFDEPFRAFETAWAFVLDGHIFYVMNYVMQHALIYDTVAQQWYRWHTKDALLAVEPYWNMFRGMVWNGRVLAADFNAARIWEIDALSTLDEGIKPIERAVTGFQPLRGSASVRQGALRVIARKEDAAVPSTLTMRFSDDSGKTWSTERTVLLAANSYSQRLEFRSLGRIRAPGRLWEIRDTGGFVRIDGADGDLEGES